MTRHVERSVVGQVMYTTWCNDAGKVIDDGTVTRLDEQQFRLTAAEPNLRWLYEHGTGLRFEIQDVSDAIGALSLQGPLSREILSDAVDDDITSLRFFRSTATKLAGIPIAVSRTGLHRRLGVRNLARRSTCRRVVGRTHGQPESGTV